MVEPRRIRGLTVSRRLKGIAGRAQQGSAQPSGGQGPVDPPDLVSASPLFDDEWYALQVGRPFPRRRAAARHYLEKGGKRGFTPHPLFDPAYFAKNLPTPPQGDPFLAFLSDPALRAAPTHPLFDTASYLEAHPEAASHSGGPLGHYLEVGARDSDAPNEWYRPDPDREPEGLASWMRGHGRRWSERMKTAVPTWSSRYDADAAESEKARRLDQPQRREHGATDSLVSVILLSGSDPVALGATIRSVSEQTHPAWELLVVDTNGIPDLATRLSDAVDSGRLRIVSADTHDVPALNVALDQAAGRYVTWIFPGEAWEHERLELLTLACAEGNHDGVHDILEAHDESGPSRYAGGPFGSERLVAHARPFLSQLLLLREAACSLGQLDANLPHAWDMEFAYRAHRRLGLDYLPVLGTRRDNAAYARSRRPPARELPLVDHESIATWDDVLINRSAIDWARLSESHRDPSVVSVVIPTYNDWRYTNAAVRSVSAAGSPEGMTVEVVVLDNGSTMHTSVILDSLSERFPNVKVVHSPVNHGFALGNNFALPHTRGEVIVFLNNDTVVGDGWLSPLLARLGDPDVLGAQSLLVYPTGSVQSAGVAFPSCGGIPHPFLQGFPVEDARVTDSLSFSALTGAALALRFTDVVRLRGFDPLFLNGMEDVDFCLRLKEQSGGHFVVVPTSVVTHYESRTPGRFKRSVTNRRLYLDRWMDRAPKDDQELWRAAGFEVLGHEIRNEVADDRRLSVPEPVLTRRPVVVVNEARPRLRWAIKNPASAGEWGEYWGDTHFARSLAAALRALDQTVVIDHRPEFYRASARLDDVVLVLRGREPYRPAFGQVNLAWVISHPETVTRMEAASYDRILAASEQWASKNSKTWDLRIEPLLQATDPATFHPDRAEPDTGHPVLFVGGSRHEFRPMVRMALERGLPLSVFGKYWEEFIPPEYISGQWVDNDRVGAMYRAAGVVLNDHWETMRSDGFISNRLFDAVAAGARVVSDDISGLDGLFGRAVQVATSADELVRLTNPDHFDAVFGDDEERREVSARVRREHSFEARAKTLLETALTIRSTQGMDGR